MFLQFSSWLLLHPTLSQHLQKDHLKLCQEVCDIYLIDSATAKYYYSCISPKLVSAFKLKWTLHFHDYNKIAESKLIIAESKQRKVRALVYLLLTYSQPQTLK